MRQLFSLFLTDTDLYVTTKLSTHLPPLLFFAVHSRSVHSDDGSLLPEEEDRLLCHPDLHALLHDCNPVTGFLLAQPGVGASTDCFR